jgi:hypothetical protein
MRKTTKAAKQAIDNHIDMLRGTEQCLRDLEIVPPIPGMRTREFYEGWITGVQSLTEAILHQERCYRGYYYVDSAGLPLVVRNGDHITDHPEYREYRVRFFTNWPE